MWPREFVSFAPVGLPRRLDTLGANWDSVPVVPAETTETQWTVLITEDEFLVRWTAAEFLRERGYVVIEATSAADAISILESGTHVDIVFSDVHMPGELTGNGLAEWLGRNHPGLPVLLTSGAATGADNITAGDKRRFITKPYDLSELDAVIASMRP
jgi:DNA-binding NtrC family response regulator